MNFKRERSVRFCVENNAEQKSAHILLNRNRSTFRSDRRRYFYDEREPGLRRLLVESSSEQRDYSRRGAQKTTAALERRFEQRSQPHDSRLLDNRR